ncbi:unnamed protein product [Knipowitschia caucasica]
MCMSRAIKSTCESSSFKLHSLPALRTRFQNLKKMGLTEGDGCERSALLLAKLNHQRMKAEFCDCVIRKGQGQIFPVHKCIIAASSPVLASILCSSGVLVELEAACLSDCILELVLDYIYTGTLPDLDYKLYLYLLAAAQYLEMDELQFSIRTKAGTLEHSNNTNNEEAIEFALLQPTMDCYEKPSEPLRCTPMEGKSISIGFNNIYMTSKPENYGISRTEYASKHKRGSSFSEDTEQSGVSQEQEKNQSAWHENKEKARSLIFVSTEEQQIQMNRAKDLCKQRVSNEDNNCIRLCCSTSVIRHSSRVTGEHEENVAVKRPHDTEAKTSHIQPERTCQDGKDRFFNRPPDSPPLHEDNMFSANLSKHKNLPDIDSKENNIYQNDNNHRQKSCKMDKKTCSVLGDTIVAPSDTRKKFKDKEMRKLKEEQGVKCAKLANSDVACSDAAVAETKTDSPDEDTLLESSSIPTVRRCESSPGPVEDNTCQPSYSGQLLYCEPGGSHIPNFSPTLSDTSSEDNTSTFSDFATSEGQVVLLDISSTTETLVSYKNTTQMGTHADTIDRIKTDHDQTPNLGFQGGNESHITSCHEDGAHIWAGSLTSCTRVTNSSCVSAVSCLSPSSNMQTSVSPMHHAFRCSLCERSFSQRGSLNRHVKSHLGVRPFPCPQCPMSFSRQYRVTEHMRVHQRSALGADCTKPSTV